MKFLRIFYLIFSFRLFYWFTSNKIQVFDLTVPFILVNAFTSGLKNIAIKLTETILFTALWHNLFSWLHQVPYTTFIQGGSSGLLIISFFSTKHEIVSNNKHYLEEKKITFKICLDNLNDNHNFSAYTTLPCLKFSLDP